jgi:hypothetical protein
MLANPTLTCKECKPRAELEPRKFTPDTAPSTTVYLNRLLAHNCLDLFSPVQRSLASEMGAK